MGRLKGSLESGGEHYRISKLLRREAINYPDPLFV